MQIQDYDIILNSLQETGIYVIREDNHQILYFNQRVKEVTPEVELGMVCHELWKESCASCPLQYIKNKKESRSICYSSPFGNPADITANRIVWQNKVPAFLISVTPHMEGANYTYNVIMKANLATGHYSIIKSNVAKKNSFADRCPTLPELLTEYVKSSNVHKNDTKRFLEFTQINHLLAELKKPKKMAAFTYRHKSGQDYRWHTLEIVPDYNYSDENQTVMLYIKDIHDIYSKGLALEELNIRNQEIIASLSEMNFAIYVIDLDTGMMNPVRAAKDIDDIAGLKITDWDEILINSVDSLYHPDYKDKILQTYSLEALRKSRDNGKQKLELLCQRMIHSVYHYVSITTYFHESSSGNNFVVMAIQDVDKRARQEIRQSQDDIRIAALIKSRYSYINTVDLTTGVFEQTYLDNSTTPGRTIKGDYNAFIEKAVKELIYEEDKEQFQNYLLLDNLRQMAKQEESSSEIIFEYRLKGPKLVWLQEQILFIRQGSSIIANMLGRDITEKKRKEAEEKKEKQDRSYIIDSMSSLFFATYYIDLITDTFRIIKQVSKSGNILSITQNYNEAISTYSQHSVHPDDREEYIRTMGLPNLLKSLTPHHPCVAMEYHRIRKRDNAIKENGWIRATVILVEMNNGVPTKALYVEQDVTESKRKEERELRILREACDAANHANASKSEFLSRVSHDIRTPLNAIIGMTTIAGSHLENPGKISDCLDKIMVSSKHLLSLINEVLDMSKIESGKLELTQEKFNLSDLMQNVLTIIRPTLQAKQHTLEFCIVKVEHDEVIGDMSRLQQVFMNILGNAVKYTPDGGKLKLEVLEKSSVLYDCSCYEFIFEDNGIGMSEEYLTHIFDPFSRAEDTRTNKIEGTGLGMTIAQNIIQMMNGNIDIESKLNQGSRFTVTVYLKRQNTETPDMEPYKGRRVLVAGQNASSCESSCSVLKDIGIKSEWITNGNEVIKRIQEAEQEKAHFFAIIIDQKLQDLDGIQLAETIKKKFGKQAPFTILSVSDWDSEKMDAHYEGVDGLISKPLFKSRLLYLLKNIVEHRSKENSCEEEISPEQAFHGKRILLVDDIEINREIASEIIGSMGITVETASDGKEALDKFEEMGTGYYQLIFMDIQMPVMNGYESTKAIRKSKQADSGTIPIIAMTANAFTEDIIASKHAGMNEHIAKPLNIDQLIGCLKRFLI